MTGRTRRNSERPAWPKASTSYLTIGIEALRDEHVVADFHPPMRNLLQDGNLTGTKDNGQLIGEPFSFTNDRCSVLFFLRSVH